MAGSASNYAFMAFALELYFSKSGAGLERDGGELAYIKAHRFVAGIVVPCSDFSSSYEADLTPQSI